MKKLILIACLFCGLNTSAQNGFFLQPEIGVGISNTNAKFSTMNIPGTYSWPPTSIFTYDCQLGVGYNFSHWAISSGVYYLRSGYKWHYTGGDFITVDC